MTSPVTLRATRRLGRTQELIWASQRLHPAAPVANTANAYRIRGPLDPDRLVAAFDAVVRASDALRTVVVDAGGTPHPAVQGEPPGRTEVIDLDAGARDAWATARIATPLPVERCGYDSVLLRHGPDDWTWYLAFHHLLVDAWGATVAYRATADAYHGRPLHLPPVADHLAAVEAARTTPAWQRARDHWAGAGGPPEPTGLYRDGPPTTASSRLPVDLDPARHQALGRLLAEDLRPLSRELGVLAVLATTTVAYLHRLSGRRSLRIGVPVHHRTDADARATIGLLMELFPLEVSITDGETFRSLYTRVSASLFDLLRWARPGTSPRPEFDVVLNVITATAGPFGDLPATAEWVHSGHVDPAHRLRVQYFDFTGDGAPTLALDLNEAVADDDQRRRAPGHLRAVLDALLADVDGPVGGFALVDAEERHELVAAYNDTGGPRPGDRPLAAEILPALRAAGDAVALVDGDVHLTGSELARRIEDVAAGLAGRGVGPGTRVGIGLARSGAAMVAIHAVVQAGAAFVPLDPAYPEARLRHLAADARLDLVVDDPAVLDTLAEEGAGRTGPGPAPLGGAGLDDEAYVLYTSGSTGTPKGVPITHRGLTEYLAFARDAYLEPGEAPVVGLFTSLSFDLTITSVFLAPLAGGTTVVLRGDGAEAVARLAGDDRITLAKATPSHLELLVRLLGPGHGLRTVIVGGEQFPRALAARLAAVAPGARIFNEYGPTEAVVGCMIHRYDPDRDRGPAVPIGVPAPGVRLYVVDEAGHPTPRGVPGELHVARPGLSPGYLNQPELTAERFVALADLGEDRAYRTGDLVRFCAPGTMEYLGRTDEQVKVHGIRLEPAEVEAALAEHPGVEAAAVRAWQPGRTGGRRQRCVRCGLGSDVPGTDFDDEGVCADCRAFDDVATQAQRWFGTVEDLVAIRDRARSRRAGRYDVLHLLSGGKDSTYALYRLVELGFDVRTLTLDNGFISEQAKDNVRRVVTDLGVDHEFATTDAMNDIFRDSLERYANVCNGCYKTIYTLAVNRADELGIPVIVTGLSRGQLFETRLVPGQFARDRFDPEAIDAAVLAARRVYHRTSDAVSRLLDVSRFDDDALFDRIEFVDFYRYLDVELDDMLAFLDARAPWIRPSDTGRSTNCLINAAGIAVHKLERGFHNYAVPYSWDVRVGHKTRDEALEELDDPPDDDEVRRILDEVGYQPRPRSILTAWYRTGAVPPVALDPDELRRHLADRVPAHAVPAAFVAVDELPLSANGKLDEGALPAPTQRHRDDSTGYLPPRGPVEETVCELWASLLGLDRVGATDDFFDLGGTSLAALEVVLLLSETYGVTIADDRAFLRRTARELAAEIEALVVASVEAMDDDEVADELAGG